METYEFYQGSSWQSGVKLARRWSFLHFEGNFIREKRHGLLAGERGGVYIRVLLDCLVTISSMQWLAGFIRGRYTYENFSQKKRFFI